MNGMHPILVWILATAAVMLPITVVLNVTGASQAVVAPVVVLALGTCSAVGAKLYLDSKPR